MASSPSELEQRVSVLEAEMDKLKRKLDQLDVAKPWWEQITGTFEDDPVYDEAMKRGRTVLEECVGVSGESCYAYKSPVLSQRVAAIN